MGHDLMCPETSERISDMLGIDFCLCELIEMVRRDERERQHDLERWSEEIH